MCVFIIFCVLGLSPVATLLIGYYHGMLLRDTNADSLIVTMYSTGLLTAQELNMILFGHSFHYRNWLLLECVRHMNSQALLAFSELVKDVWPQIGMQLVTGMNDFTGANFDIYVHTYLIYYYTCVYFVCRYVCS